MPKRSWLDLTLPDYNGTLRSVESLAGLNTANKFTSPSLLDTCCGSNPRLSCLCYFVPDYLAPAKLPSFLFFFHQVQTNPHVAPFLKYLERCLCSKTAPRPNPKCCATTKSCKEISKYIPQAKTHLQALLVAACFRGNRGVPRLSLAVFLLFPPFN